MADTATSDYFLEESKAGPQRRARSVGGSRETPLDGLLQKIADEPKKHSKWFKVRAYDKRSSASGTQVQLRGKYGNTEACTGWSFEVGAGDDKVEREQGKYVLHVRYAPDAVVEGAMDVWSKEWNEKLVAKYARYKATRQEKIAAEKANGATKTEKKAKK